MERVPVGRLSSDGGRSEAAPARPAFYNAGSDTLGKLLTELCYRSPGTEQHVGETTLKMHVSAEARDLTGEALTRFMNDLHSRLFKMVNRCAAACPQLD